MKVALLNMQNSCGLSILIHDVISRLEYNVLYDMIKRCSLGVQRKKIKLKPRLSVEIPAIHGICFKTITVNPEIFARVYFRENKILTNCRNHSVVYLIYVHHGLVANF